MRSVSICANWNISRTWNAIPAIRCLMFVLFSITQASSHSLDVCVCLLLLVFRSFHIWSYLSGNRTHFSVFLCNQLHALQQNAHAFSMEYEIMYIMCLGVCVCERMWILAITCVLTRRFVLFTLLLNIEPIFVYSSIIHSPFICPAVAAATILKSVHKNSNHWARSACYQYRNGDFVSLSQLYDTHNEGTKK